MAVCQTWQIYIIQLAYLEIAVDRLPQNSSDTCAAAGGVSEDRYMLGYFIHLQC